MSIATEITRLQTAKANLKTSIENKGVTVPSATTLSGYSALVDSIETGGGSVTLTHAGFWGAVSDGTIYYTDENMQSQSSSSLDANLPSGSIVAVIAESSAGIMFSPNPYDPTADVFFGMTQLGSIVISRKKIAYAFVVN